MCNLYQKENLEHFLLLCPMLAEPWKAFLSNLYHPDDSIFSTISSTLNVKDRTHLKMIPNNENKMLQMCNRLCSIESEANP